MCTRLLIDINEMFESVSLLLILNQTFLFYISVFYFVYRALQSAKLLPLFYPVSPNQLSLFLTE